MGLAKAALEAINGFNLFGNQVIKMCFLFFFNCSFFLENLKKRNSCKNFSCSCQELFSYSIVTEINKYANKEAFLD